MKRSRSGGLGEARNAKRTQVGHHAVRETENLSWACPFYKRDPIEHMDCVTFRMRRIADVRQHILRKHCKQSFYCPVCRRKFPNPEQRDDHIKRRDCTEDLSPGSLSDADDPSVASVSFEKQTQLRGRVSRLDPEKSWYQIWAVLFDSAPCPATPYQSTVMEEAAGVLPGQWGKHHSAILSSIFEDMPRDFRQELEPLRSELPGLFAITLSKLIGTLTPAVNDGDSGGSKEAGCPCQLASTASSGHAGLSFNDPQGFNRAMRRATETTSLDTPGQSAFGLDASDVYFHGYPFMLSAEYGTSDYCQLPLDANFTADFSWCPASESLAYLYSFGGGDQTQMVSPCNTGMMPST
ncbi:hypothetical protein QBC34DRAFT_397780 [Podospora aff. communis PSN243]|uniref:C2H2-type domain-containing protein n=1 Tax=Podospora aff. communis PSN243 TaxID=3040156 RepID=A0AAV9GZD0_9PEZI|nr:hypothetical protein QBC34DRAFT_397780 [Podospora aff. communis PSN243]